MAIAVFLFLGPRSEVLSETHTITGGIAITGYLTDSGECNGLGLWQGLGSGKQVRIMDENGKVLAIAALVLKSSNHEADLESNAVNCVLIFSLPNVPKARFYALEVAGQSGPTYSYHQLSNMNWVVVLQIGL